MTEKNDVVVHMPALGRLIANVHLSVQVEEVSESDVPAVVLARLTLTLPLLDLSNPLELRFEIPIPKAMPNMAVSGALTQQGPRAPRPGDLITEKNVQITPGAPTHLHLVEYRPR